MKIFTKTLTYKTSGFFDVIDITDDVIGFLKENSHAQNGFVTVYTKHTTTSIKINENEKGFLEDLKQFCQKLVPEKGTYEHNNLEKREKRTLCHIEEECLNGHSHILQMLIGSASETIPIQEGKLQLGKWQRILLIELDIGKNREIIVQIAF